jgi:hypothetical protein
MKRPWTEGGWGRAGARDHVHVLYEELVLIESLGPLLQNPV